MLHILKGKGNCSKLGRQGSMYSTVDADATKGGQQALHESNHNAMCDTVRVAYFGSAYCTFENSTVYVVRLKPENCDH